MKNPAPPAGEYSKVVAIDGPSGSGKSTVARAVAKKMNFLYVDTGAMFRAVAYALKKKSIDPQKLPELEKALSELDLEYGISDTCLIRAGGEDLTAVIRDHAISELASQYSKIPVVRQYLQDFQRSLVQEKICVMEGRDIGTVIFPNSFCKIFLTAKLEVRAGRRYRELQEKGSAVPLEQLVEDMRIRDERDSQRDLAPLKAASDAYNLDSSELTLDEVISHVQEVVKQKLVKIMP